MSSAPASNSVPTRGGTRASDQQPSTSSISSRPQPAASTRPSSGGAASLIVQDETTSNRNGTGGSRGARCRNPVSRACSSTSSTGRSSTPPSDKGDDGDDDASEDSDLDTDDDSDSDGEDKGDNIEPGELPIDYKVENWARNGHISGEVLEVMADYHLLEFYDGLVDMEELEDEVEMTRKEVDNALLPLTWAVENNNYKQLERPLDKYLKTLAKFTKQSMAAVKRLAKENAELRADVAALQYTHEAHLRQMRIVSCK